MARRSLGQPGLGVFVGFVYTGLRVLPRRGFWGGDFSGLARNTGQPVDTATLFTYYQANVYLF